MEGGRGGLRREWWLLGLERGQPPAIYITLRTLYIHTHTCMYTAWMYVLVCVCMLNVCVQCISGNAHKPGGGDRAL